MHVDEREEEEERGERQPRVEEREPCVEETELGVLAPGVARSPASEREDRRRDS
jgi:hypothetical protein